MTRASTESTACGTCLTDDLRDRYYVEYPSEEEKMRCARLHMRYDERDERGS